MIEIEELNKNFGSQAVIHDFSCEFSDTGVTLIVGTNGSGKTTLLNIMANLLQADSGNILLNNCMLDTKEYKSQLYYIPSDFYLPDYMTGLEYIEFILSRYESSEKDKVEWLLGLLDLDKDKNKTLETYSFGMKKKIQIVAAIEVNTKFIILDEIFNGLDFETTILVQHLLKRLSENKKIIMVSHEGNILNAFPEDIRLLRKGKLERFEGKPSELYEVIKQEGTLHGRLHEIEERI